MKKNYVLLIATLVSLFSNTVSFAQTPQWIWAKNVQAPLSDYATGISTDKKGNSYVTGYYDGAVSFGTFALSFSGRGGNSVYIAKYDGSGNVLWAQSPMGGGLGGGIATDAIGNSYVVGDMEDVNMSFDSSITLPNNGITNIFVAKYDTSGNVIWARGAGGTDNDYATAVATDNTGNCYVTGYFYSTSITFGTTTLTNSSGYPEVFIVKYDSSGNVVWAKSSVGNLHDGASGVATDASGNVYITGSFQSTQITFGSTILTNNGIGNIFMVKYSPSGNLQWAKSFGGTSFDVGSGIAISNNGNYYLTGAFNSSSIAFGSITLTNNGTYDIYITKFDASGNILWAKSVGGTGNDVGKSVATDSIGNCYVTGSFTDSTLTFGTITLQGNGIQDIFVTKYNPTGSAVWAKNATGNGEGTSICARGSNNCYITGNFSSTQITFGSDSLPRYGNPNVFVAALGSTVGISENYVLHTLVAYPNPANGAFRIVASRFFQGMLTIYNLLGQEVYATPFEGNNKIIDARLPAGLYLLQLADGKEIWKGKMVVQ